VSRRCSVALASACVLVGTTLGCGGSQSEGVGRSDRVPDRAPIELTLRTPDGAFVDVGDLRGQPTLLFLFATFDGVSQASLRTLRRFFLRHPDVHLVGIAVQPQAAELVGAYAEALHVPFTVTYEPEERIAVGLSSLGAFEAVPTFVMLDARGREVGRHVGFASDRKLETFLERARAVGAAGPARRP